MADDQPLAGSGGLTMAVRLLKHRVDEQPPRAEAPPSRLFVRPELVRAVAAATAGADPFETGGPLLGTIQRSWTGTRFAPVVSVLGTVLPAPGTRGRRASVSLGERSEGDRAASALRWLRSTTALDLIHLGDWHAHPSGVCRPSLGDVKTAVAMEAESGAPVWLSAIAVSRCEWGEDVAAQEGAARYTRDRLDAAEMRFFQAVGQRLVPLSARIDAAALPQLPPLPWHVADPVRFAAECRLLAAAGFKVAIDSSPNGRPGLSLRVRREGGGALTIGTGLAYPGSPPELHDEHGRRIALRTPFSPDRFLVDLVCEVAP